MTPMSIFEGFGKQTLRAVPLALAIAVLSVGSAAADTIRVGKASAGTFAFAPIDVGKDKGIWAKHGLEIESIGFGGDARLQQAMVANSIDFALGSGPGMGFLAKGVPSIAVAALANEPLSMGLSVGRNSPIKTADDLKGALVSVATAGSLTFWLAHEFSRQRGWGPQRDQDGATGRQSGAGGRLEGRAGARDRGIVLGRLHVGKGRRGAGTRGIR
jgi:ABC-type nitrate/sulfonate/bicarbonate transport system substrate-binding protein